ncbi:DUF4922 domain-containing protein [Paenalcaligenes hominis]|uniref:ATP adenylyltransferase family protein n=1 Tax=Paenalcaligenes hominis TaxID=643674 RepID=UPI00352513E8
MMTSFMQSINACMEHALQAGVLQPIEFHAEAVPTHDVNFQICWVPALSIKANGTPKGFPGSAHDANFNPFLPPDPTLTVGRLGDYHHAVLNKFPVCAQHLVIPRVDYADQRSRLQYEDFLALTLLLTEYGGLGFFNGGPEAGASQHHLHVQWLPDAPTNASLIPFVKDLDPELEYQIQQQRHWPFPHAFVYIEPSSDPYEYARDLYQSYQRICQQMQLQPCTQGFMPPLNLLIQQGWLLIVPRSQNHINDISLNALSFAGVIYVREKEHIDFVKKQGILHVLAAVST